MTTTTGENKQGAGHTPTPWRTHNNIGRKSELGIIADDAPCIIACMSNAKEYPSEARANLAFIVTACNEHDALKAQVAAQAEEVARLRGALEATEKRLDELHEYCIYAECAYVGSEDGKLTIKTLKHAQSALAGGEKRGAK